MLPNYLFHIHSMNIEWLSSKKQLPNVLKLKMRAQQYSLSQLKMIAMVVYEIFPCEWKNLSKITGRQSTFSFFSPDI